MAKLIELSAIFHNERFRFSNADGDVIIADAQLVNGSCEESSDPYITIKGKADLDELQQQQSYRFYGKWANYQNKYSGKTEKQFHFQTFVESAPHGRAGIITYLKRAGEGNGIGHARSAKIYDLFGSDSVRMLREEPERVAQAVRGLKIEDCKMASEWLGERQQLENVTLEVTDLLDKRGMPIRRDGMLRVDARLKSGAMIVSFDSKVGPLSYPCDSFVHWDCNLRAIALSLEALRKIDRYGVTQNAQQYKGCGPWALR